VTAPTAARSWSSWGLAADSSRRHAGITLGGDQGTISFADEGGAAEESDQKAPLGPGRPPRMDTYGDLVPAKNRALPLAVSMPGVNANTSPCRRSVDGLAGEDGSCLAAT